MKSELFSHSSGLKRLLTVSVARMRENGNAVAPAANGQPKVDCVPFNSAEVVRRSASKGVHCGRPASPKHTNACERQAYSTIRWDRL